MKCLLIVLVSVTLALAELPVRQNSRFSKQFERQEQAPYQPSGWRPAGPEFQLPSRQETPQNSYIPPPQEYGPPQGGTDETETTTSYQSTTYDYSEQIQVKDAGKKNNSKSEKLQEKPSDKEEIKEGAYYIYHPSGLLQRVMYVTKSDLENMGYTAQLRYKNVDPISGPIFTYNPDTLEFSRVQ